MAVGGACCFCTACDELLHINQHERMPPVAADQLCSSGYVMCKGQCHGTTTMPYCSSSSSGLYLMGHATAASVILTWSDACIEWYTLAILVTNTLLLSTAQSTAACSAAAAAAAGSDANIRSDLLG